MVEMGKRFGALFFAVMILVCSPAACVKAEDYTYTVRFYAGQQGTFSGGREMIVYDGLTYGSVVSFNVGSNGVILKDNSKYYVKGIRESGRDNNTVSASSFVVTGDRDYVVAYGLRGDMVAYTVNYVDVNGTALAPSDTYYGNIGDKPVVAFLYIDGYQPQAYNLTKTLLENEAENVFTFVYFPIDGVNTDPTVTRTVLPSSERSVVEVIPGDRVRSSRQGIERSGRENMGSDMSTDMETGFVDGLDFSSQMTVADPFASIDLDGIDLADPAVPLAEMKFKIGPVEVGAKMMLVMIVILVAVLTVAAASWWYWKPYRKKDKDEEKNAAQPV